MRSSLCARRPGRASSSGWTVSWQRCSGLATTSEIGTPSSRPGSAAAWAVPRSSRATPGVHPASSPSVFAVERPCLTRINVGMRPRVGVRRTAASFERRENTLRDRRLCHLPGGTPFGGPRGPVGRAGSGAPGGRVRLDRAARADGEGVRAGHQGVRTASAGGGGRPQGASAAQAGGVRRLPVRGPQAGGVRTGERHRVHRRGHALPRRRLRGDGASWRGLAAEGRAGASGARAEAARQGPHLGAVRGGRRRRGPLPGGVDGARDRSGGTGGGGVLAGRRRFPGHRLADLHLQAADPGVPAGPPSRCRCR
ncbi:hypothetical protein M2162_006546 [Streptomyces sp. SAI-041]|nr:hypothetical protein [Streptomyces sp. SAI-041]